MKPLLLLRGWKSECIQVYQLYVESYAQISCIIFISTVPDKEFYSVSCVEVVRYLGIPIPRYNS